MVRITGSPGQRLLMTLPDSMEFDHRNGRLWLTSMRYAVAEAVDSEEFSEINTDECVMIEIPDSGELYLRVGGTVTVAQGFSNGFSRGTLPFSASCVD